MLYRTVKLSLKTNILGFLNSEKKLSIVQVLGLEVLKLLKT